MSVRGKGGRLAGNDEPVVERPEVLEYYQRKHRRGPRESGEVVAAKVDRVAPGIVARINIVKLYGLSIRCVRIGLALALPPGVGPRWPARLAREPEPPCPHRPTDRGGAAVKLLDKEEARRRLERRGGPHDEHLDATARLVAERLCEDATLLYHADPRQFFGTDWANLFCVEKHSAADVSYRVIIDARRANSKVDKRPYGFELFTLDTLINTIAELSHRRDADGEPCPFYFASADSRHHFHQIPLVDVAKREQFYLQGEDGRCFLPRAFVMGWTLAPLAGHCVTWGLLLSCEESSGRFAPGRESGLTPEAIAALPRDKPPAWLPLEGGGGIFVIIDNIFVVTPRKEVRDYWAKRIITCANRFNLRLKDSTDKRDEYLDACGAKPNKPACSSRITDSDTHHGAVEVGTLRGTSRSVCFMGIEFNGVGRRVKLDEEPEEAPGTFDPATGCWNGTRRELWSLLGVLLWWRRVAGLDSFERNEDMELTRRLYAAFSPAPDAPRSAWRDSVRLTAADSEGLARLWRERAANEFTIYRRIDPVARPWFGACDASLADGLSGLGVVSFGAFPADAVPERAEAAPPGVGAHRRELIALAELEALRRTVELGHSEAPNSTLFVIASDNTNAIRWAQRRYARSDEGNEELRRLYTALGNRRLLLVYVPSAENVADNASRGERTCDAARTRATWRALRDAYQRSGSRTNQPGLGQAEVARAGGGAAAHAAPPPSEADRRRQREEDA